MCHFPVGIRGVRLTLNIQNNLFYLGIFGLLQNNFLRTNTLTIRTFINSGKISLSDQPVNPILRYLSTFNNMPQQPTIYVRDNKVVTYMRKHVTHI